MPKNLYLREGIYWARLKIRGEEYRQSLRTRTERVAVKRLAALREQLEDQAVYGIAGPISWQEAVVSWNGSLADSLGDRTFARYATSLRQLRGFLDEKSVQEIDANLLREIITARKRAGLKNATIRRDLTAISSVLNHAVDEGWIDENAATAINRRRIVPERVVKVVLPREDMMALMFPRLPARIRDLCEFTRETGLRLDEATGLKHHAVDRAERVITITRGKGDKVRAVALTPAAEAIMDRQPRFIGKPWVFWKDSGARLTNVSTRLAKNMRREARKAAQRGEDFEPFSHHDFRHLFAVEYLRRGRGSIYDLQAELGHDSISTTERYLAFLTPDQAKAAKSGVAQKGAQEPRFEVATA